MKLRNSYQLTLRQLISSVEEESNNFGMVKIPEKASCFIEPSIISLSGNTVSTARECRGDAKRATRLAGVCGYKDINIFGTSYSGDTSTDYIQQYNSAFKGRPENYGKEAYNFVQNKIQPLITNPDGSKLDVNSAKKNLRNINILASSFGAVVAEEIGNATYDQMEELGFCQAEIAEATSQILVISVAGGALLGLGRASFRRITVMNRYDESLVMDHMFKSPVRTNGFVLSGLLHNAEKSGSHLSVLKFSDNEVVIAVNKELTGMARINRNGEFFVKDGKRFVPTYYLQDHQNHHPDLYTVPGIGLARHEGLRYGEGHLGFFIPALLSNAMSAAVENSLFNHRNPNQFTELPPTEQLLSSAKTRADTTTTRKLLSNYADNPSFVKRLANDLAKPLTLSK